MNTLKPLLTVAVLAGIGYGVYIRLNAGAGAPPPPVDAGWNSTPDIQLPGQASSAPWGAPSTPASGNAMVPGGQAPPYQQAPAGGSTGSEAPPFGQPAPTTSAPPFGDSAPHAHSDVATANTAPPTGTPEGVSYEPPSYEAMPQNPAGTEMSTSPRGADLHGNDPYPPSQGADPYRAPTETSPPADFSPGDYPVPPDDGVPVDGGAAPVGEFAAAMQAANSELENGQLAAALRQLSPWYGNPQLAPEQEQQLKPLLDQVAGTVVYSTQNLLEHPYEVQPGERLETIGEKYQVPWQLLAKINGIEDPNSLQPGERLKVIRGPFEAVIDLKRRELVLHTADGLYAGRFQIGIGGEHPPQEGTFVVSDKSVNPVYYGSERAIGAEDPNNPLGERWIGLGKQMAIHGTNNPQNIGRTDLPGWISLSEPDVEDVYDILSLGSRVTIRR